MFTYSLKIINRIICPDSARNQPPKMVKSWYLKTILRQPRLPSTEIPGHVMDKVIGKPSERSPVKFLWQFRKEIIQKRFADFGQSSGLKPGVCWPSREELEFLKQYEAKFERTTAQMHETLLQEKKAEQAKRAKREKEIQANLKKLPKMKEEFWKSYHKLYDDIEMEKVKKEKLIQEVREYLGYDIEPNDPRFEEALAKKDEESKAAMRAARKLEKQKQHMEMLQALVSEALEKEATESKKNNKPPNANEEAKDKPS